MAVVERQEAIDGQLRAEVVVLATEHLLTHTGADLRLEVQDGTETEITSLAALVVLRVLDTTTATKCVHTGVDILVQVEALLRLRDTATRRHVQSIEEIGVTVVELPANVCK